MLKRLGDWLGSISGRETEDDAADDDDGPAEETPEQRRERHWREHLRVLAQTEKPPWVTLPEIIKRSKKFVVKFPIDTARLSTLQKKGHDTEKLEKYVNSAYPLVHERLLPLLVSFLHHKRKHGTSIERKMYKDLDLLGLVDRLLKKRPLVFVGNLDKHLLRSGKEGTNGFENIGTKSEKGDLILANYMSYDEMKLSALVSVSSRSFFINDGSRHNCGVPGDPGSFQPEGVIVGMVGTRLHRRCVMEWQDCMIAPEQNTVANGYGKTSQGKERLQQEWSRLWGIELPTWDKASAAPKDTFLYLTPTLLFNREVYKARIQYSAETLLAEAGERAKGEGLQAYVHVVGLGLGVWRISSLQYAMYVDAWGEALKVTDTSTIAHVDFSWIGVDNCLGVKDGEVFPGTDVILHFSRRALHAPVPSGTLLVTNFAWDSNSMPGNEYWMGSLSSSGDPAAACSSGVAELHNALINPRVTAANLHIASSKGIEHVADYAQRTLQFKDHLQQ